MAYVHLKPLSLLTKPYFKICNFADLATSLQHLSLEAIDDAVSYDPSVSSLPLNSAAAGSYYRLDDEPFTRISPGQTERDHSFDPSTLIDTFVDPNIHSTSIHESSAALTNDDLSLDSAVYVDLDNISNRNFVASPRPPGGIAEVTTAADQDYSSVRADSVNVRGNQLLEASAAVTGHNPTTDRACDSDDSTDDESRCAVCFLQMVHPVRLPCNHVFCFLCVKVSSPHHMPSLLIVHFLKYNT